MKKNIFNYQCKECKKGYVKWQGNCYECGCFNSLEQITQITNLNHITAKLPSLIDTITIEKKSKRIITQISEFDRVLGGGILPDSVILLSGNPGIGKSTFLLQVVCSLSDSYKILYVSTEESEEQIKLRLLRLTNQKLNWYILQETNFEVILQTIVEQKLDIVILDSLQNLTMHTDSLLNHIQRIKEVTQKLVEHAKENKYVLLMTGHVTKDGEIAGPKALEHLVDTVLYFEADESSNLRILRSTKNRFGAIDEVGFFQMTENGMQECKNPQEIFIENNKPNIGSALTWTKEGSRSFLIEIQTLLISSRNHSPQRTIQGIEHKQFLLLCAVIEKYLKIPLFEFDIFSKVTGNFKFRDSHGDLAIIISILSSYLNKILKNKTVFHGEVNLSGNVLAKYTIPKKLPLEKYGINTVITGKTIEENDIHAEKKVIQSIYQIINLFE